MEPTSGPSHEPERSGEGREESAVKVAWRGLSQLLLGFDRAAMGSRSEDASLIGEIPLRTVDRSIPVKTELFEQITNIQLLQTSPGVETAQLDGVKKFVTLVQNILAEPYWATLSAKLATNTGGATSTATYASLNKLETALLVGLARYAYALTCEDLNDRCSSDLASAVLNPKDLDGLRSLSRGDVPNFIPSRFIYFLNAATGSKHSYTPSLIKRYLEAVEAYLGIITTYADKANPMSKIPPELGTLINAFEQGANIEGERSFTCEHVGQILDKTLRPIYSNIGHQFANQILSARNPSSHLSVRNTIWGAFDYYHSPDVRKGILSAILSSFQRFPRHRFDAAGLKTAGWLSSIANGGTYTPYTPDSGSPISLIFKQPFRAALYYVAGWRLFRR